MLLRVYNLFLPLLIALVRIAGLFHPKLRKALHGRDGWRKRLEGDYAKVAKSRKRVLIHVASFGELEQAKPVIAMLKQQDPATHIHLTFFSPSGYENAVGKYDLPDLITYSPIDKLEWVREFLQIVQPDLALFVKYDVWPNMALELQRKNVPTVLFSASAGKASRRMLPVARQLNAEVYSSLSKILVISESDRGQFESLGVSGDKIIVAGDTRYDQVIERRREVQKAPALLPKSLISQIEAKGTLVFVIGSAWPQDEAVVKKALAESIERHDNILTFIVPHDPTTAHIARLKKAYGISAITLSGIAKYNREPVIIVDSIGKLFGLYQYADIAMVGGGFGSGLHNALEPAVFGLPVIVGPNHQKTKEVAQLIDAGGAFEVKNGAEFEFAFWRLVKDEDLRIETGKNAVNYVEAHRGATAKIMHEAAEVMWQ